ncbi:TPA: hypothetical protein HA338_16045 [Methanosarcina acetivorans]|uniref:Uncharacterized protein n=1 Tax=Methanosarcina acetivorans TaxID=2214 RepID=A0A832SLT2_9EURY|nr:hypothetical protein [Methanosarcina acetivorans]HIH95467.1 hypothetical protein [Methanosarcina acetivorans]
MITTVLISIFAHGISAGPAGNWHSRLVAALPDEAPERREVKELPVRKGFAIAESMQICK